MKLNFRGRTTDPNRARSNGSVDIDSISFHSHESCDSSIGNGVNDAYDDGSNTSSGVGGMAGTSLPNASLSSHSSSAGTMITNLSREPDNSQTIASFTAAMTELHHELRDKVIECEALYETAAALSHALQESDRLLQLERVKNEKLLLKLSMVCTFEEPADDEDSESTDIMGGRKKDSKKSQTDGGDADEDEDPITADLRKRAKKLSMSVMTSTNTTYKDRIAALNIQKQAESPKEIQPFRITDNKNSNKNTGIRNHGSMIVDLDDDFPRDNKPNNTLSSNTPVSTLKRDSLCTPLSPPKDSQAEQRDIEDERRKVSPPSLSNSRRLEIHHDDGSLMDKLPLPFVETNKNPTHYLTEVVPSSKRFTPPPNLLGNNLTEINESNEALLPGIETPYGMPVKTTKIEKPTTTSLPCQANFYQVILERDLAQANARRLSKELKNARLEMRQLKSRLDLSTALVEISYSETDEQSERETQIHPPTAPSNKRINNSKHQTAQQGSAIAPRRGVGWIRGGNRKPRKQSDPLQINDPADTDVGDYDPKLPPPCHRLEGVLESKHEEDKETDDDLDDESVRDYINAIASSSDADKAGGCVVPTSADHNPGIGRIIM